MAVQYVFFQAFPELGDMDSDDEFHEYEPDPSKIATQRMTKVSYTPTTVTLNGISNKFITQMRASMFGELVFGSVSLKLNICFLSYDCCEKKSGLPA